MKTSKNIEVVLGYTKFGFNLFEALAKQEKDKNIFISPVSVSIALAMTCDGACGETRKAMEKVLGIDGLTVEMVDEANKNLIDSLKNIEPAIELSVANSIWCSKDLEVNKNYIGKCMEVFNAQVQNYLDAQAINGWVSNNTEGKIKKIIESVSPYDVMVLLNAIYFKGSWTNKFDKEHTEEQNFYLPEGKAQKAALMIKKGNYKYFKGDKFQAVELPYGKKRISLFVFLPDKKDGLSEFLKKLNEKNWSSWLSDFSESEGTVKIPRFKCECEYSDSLKKVLDILGMRVAFSPKADFSLITSEKTFISDVIHKTFIEVNEEGTEAAAATAVVMMRGYSFEAGFNFVADHPFFIVIYDRETRTILFMGSIVKP